VGIDAPHKTCDTFAVSTFSKQMVRSMADPKKAKPFEREQAVYEKNHDDLIKSALGQFVVIYADRMIGPYPTYADAYQEGLRSFGDVIMLIKQVVEEEPVNSPIFGATKNQANLTCRFTT